jgi:hypothetical protein
MNMTGEGQSYRSFVRLFVLLSSWGKENDNVVAKNDDEGKKEQNLRTGRKKISCSKIGG